MKKHLAVLIFLFLGLLVLVNAQEYRKFKVGLHMGYVAPSGGGDGFVGVTEYGYRIKDEIAINLRFESMNSYVDYEGNLSSIEATTNSYTVNGQYYFSNDKFRSYCALGMGYYKPTAVSIVATSPTTATATGTIGAVLQPQGAFGFYPRLGFDYGHFNFLIDYNFVGSSDFTHITRTNGYRARKVKLSNSYLSIKFGVTIGGGKK